ncbi:membrane protein insertase YidC [Georgenia sp. Z1344]|uniref:membrane protein insertase YidC n=1 Tax=Georgenia sp. Z1344 TaxID=3416706 RepID=UPI003CF95B65
MDAILAPIRWAVAWVMVLIHDGAVAVGFPEGSGWAWIISIVGLTVVVRILIIPLFFRQIRASRAMQLVQPELKKLQDKYKNKKDPASRQRFQEEMQALYKDAGTSPFASCLPLLLQMPIFFGLFSVLNSLDNIAAGTSDAIGPLTQDLAREAENSLLFGAPISSTFMQTFGDSAANLDADLTSVRVVTVVLIIAMSLSTFFTQRQLTMKNMPPAALESPMFRQQQILLYILPVVFAVTGVNFPIGVLIYWFISNLWSMGQQFYTIKRQPTPGSDAYKAMVEKKNAKRARKGLPPLEEEIPTLKRSASAGQRKPQPKRGTEVAGATAADDAAGSADEAGDDGEFEVRGKDGLTAAERAQKRYERRQAERRLAAEKRRKREGGSSSGGAKKN